MQYAIRRATMADYDGICTVYAEADAYHRAAEPTYFREPEGPSRSQAYIESVLSDDGAAVYVAQAEGKVVGLVYVFLRQVPDVPSLVPRRYAYVDSIAVLEPYRGHGIGSALMEHAHAWARERGAYHMELGVWEFNSAAQSFYARLGYYTSRRTLAKQLDE